MDRGIITIATGKKKYIDMAISLGISISLHSPNTKTAIVTDSENKILKKLFNYIIRPPDDKNSGFLLKTSLYELTPFKNTIFIDSDCLVVSDLNNIFNELKNKKFAVYGRNVNSGFWFTDIAKLLRKIKASSLPGFNSGFIYFVKNNTTKKIFKEAQNAFYKQDYYEIQQFKGSCPDEPCIAIGMAKAGIKAYPDKLGQKFSYTPVGLVGKMHVDAIRGHAHWTVKNIGEVSPAIVHFVSRINYQEYVAERTRLRMYYSGGLKKILMPLVSSIVYWAVYLRRFVGELYHIYIIKDK